MTTCPYCESGVDQIKAGWSSDRQRYKCHACQRRYLTEPRTRGYPESLRRQALTLYGQRVSIGAISRRLGLSGQSVRNWLRASPQDAQSDVHGGGESRPYEKVPPGAVGVVPVARRRPTISDVARQAGVSRSTVSNVLNNKGRMSGATRARVQAAIEQLHFTPSALIRAIHRQRTRIIGVLIFGLTDIGQPGSGAAASLLAGISAAADAAGHHMLLYTGWEPGAGRKAALEFLDGHIDGLIWVAPALHEPALERLAEAGLPTVALLSRHVPDGIGYVNADNIGAVSRIVSHLYELGHRRIAYIGSDHDSNFQDRREGYRTGLAAVGLRQDDGLAVVAPRSFATTEATLASWLALPSPRQRSSSRTMAGAGEFGAAVRDAGLRVPEDISITGFDNSALAPGILGGLTTISQPFQKMAQLAGEHLLTMIEGAPPAVYCLTIPCELIVRASTASPPT